jgi:uncharacterized protein (DUF2147 family)
MAAGFISTPARRDVMYRSLLRFRGCIGGSLFGHTHVWHRVE